MTSSSPSPRPTLGAGFRYSAYGPKYNPGPQYWDSVGRQMAERFPGAHPETVWIVGRLHGKGTLLSYPGESANPLISFSSEDANEEALKLFDQSGTHAWLQVEPGDAPVEEVIHRMLQRYGHHPCVAGVGVDVEWFHSTDHPEGVQVSDTEANAWLSAARSHNARFRLFLKHWEEEKMPPSLREGIFFIDDSQHFSSLEHMVQEFAGWGKYFAPAPVGFQFGYRADRPWWSAFEDPAKVLGSRILENAPNTAGLYWVDFTVLEVFKPV